MIDLFQRYNPWWQEAETAFKHLIERPAVQLELQQNIDTRHIIFLTGLRRSGKSSLLKLTIQHLIGSMGVDPTHILYLSLDDYLLAKKNMPEMVDTFRRLHKIRYEEKLYLFFDEVTYQENYDVQLKNLYDNQNVKMFVSASSAVIFKQRKAFLTGRCHTVEIMPLNFDEYLNFKRIEIGPRDAHLRNRYFEDYLLGGGLPEYVLSDNPQYLKELVDDLIYKDIIAQHHIRQPNLIKDYYVLLMERAGKALSVNKIGKILNISADTANRYLNMFADTYLIHLLNRHGKTNTRLLAPKKVYAPDLGIRCLFTGLRDKGALFENYVYLRIKHRYPCYVYEQGTEIDFITENQTLIEAKYGGELTDKQKRLFNAYPAKTRLVIEGPDDVGFNSVV